MQRTHPVESWYEELPVSGETCPGPKLILSGEIERTTKRPRDSLLLVSMWTRIPDNVLTEVGMNIMLTILQDETEVSGRQLEIATAEGITVVAAKRAACCLAAALIEKGYDRNSPARIVRADPYLFSPPHRIDGITLLMAATFDFLGQTTDACGSMVSRGSYPDGLGDYRLETRD